MTIAIKINGGAAGAPGYVAAGGAVVATLADTSNVRSCAWSIVATDELTSAGDYTLVVSGSVQQTCSFTALAAGTVAELKAIVNGGLSSVTGDPDAAATIAYAKIVVLTAGGAELLVAGELAPENLIASSTHGAVKVLNEAIREWVAQPNQAIGPGAPTVAGEVTTFADATGLLLARSLAKVIDSGDGISPALTPRTAAAAVVVVGTGGGAVIAGDSADQALDPGPAPNSGVSLLNRGTRADFATLRGAERTVVIGAAETKPTGGAVADHAQLMSDSGYLEIFGAYGADPGRALVKIPTSTVVANEIFTAGGTGGEAQGAGLLITSLKVERASDGEDFLTFGSESKWHVPVAFAPGGTAVATTGDIRGEKTFTLKARNAAGLADIPIIGLAADALTFGDPAFGATAKLVGGDVTIQANADMFLSGTINVLTGSQFSINDGASAIAYDNALGTTTAALISLVNSTVATGGATVQVSPAIKLSSQVWDTDKGGGGATATLDVLMSLLPVSGTTTPGQVVWSDSVDGGAPSQFFRFGRGRGANPTSLTMAHIALLGTELVNYDGSNMTVGVTGNPTYIDGSTVNLRVVAGTRIVMGATGIGFFGGAQVVQQTRGATLTNSVTSGGTNDTIDNWTDLTTYATDAAAIRNAVYQLARAVRMHDLALRAYGLET